MNIKTGYYLIAAGTALFGIRFLLPGTTLIDTCLITILEFVAFGILLGGSIILFVKRKGHPKGVRRGAILTLIGIILLCISFVVFFAVGVMMGIEEASVSGDSDALNETFKWINIIAFMGLFALPVEIMVEGGSSFWSNKRVSVALVIIGGSLLLISSIIGYFVYVDHLEGVKEDYEGKDIEDQAVLEELSGDLFSTAQYLTKVAGSIGRFLIAIAAVITGMNIKIVEDKTGIYYPSGPIDTRPSYQYPGGTPDVEYNKERGSGPRSHKRRENRRMKPSRTIKTSRQYARNLKGLKPERVEDKIRDLVPDHTITHKIGAGGFATVYRARDHTGRIVALKLPRFLTETLDYSSVEKFRTEAEIWRKLHHSNIVDFYEADTIPIVFISVELMEGGNLKQLMEKGELTIGEGVEIMLQVLDGMSYAHRMAMVHRDIKPENILFTSDGVVKISDWGIGKFMASEGATRSMGMKGTLLYSAPEQISKRKYGNVDWATDVFQLGILFYEMLTGMNPFFDEDSAGIMGNIMNDDPKSPSSFNRDVTPELDHIVMKALEKRKEDRWRSADVMYDRLRELVDL